MNHCTPWARFVFHLFFTLSVLSTTSYCSSAGNILSLDEAHHWLSDISSIQNEIDLTQGYPPHYNRGAFGVGSGYVFALVGVGNPINQLTNIIGPNYEKSEDVKFPPVWNTLMRGENEVEFSAAVLSRVKKTSIVITDEISPSLSMITVTFAPFNKTEILRIVEVKNTSNEIIDDASVILNAKFKNDPMPVAGKVLSLDVEGRIMKISTVDESVDISDGIISIPCGELAPGESKTFFFTVLITEAGDTVAELSDKDFYSELEKNRTEWLAWREGAIEAESSDGFLGDIFDNTLALIKVQTPAETGGIAVMARYSGMWCRDTFGPVRFLLASGKYDEVRGITRFYDLATRMIGFRNRYPVDLDLSAAPESVDWDSMSPQQGDDPNLLILQYYYYYRYTGDTDFIREHYGFLRRNLTGQKHDAYRLPFHSDETYQVFVAMTESATMHDFFTADTGFEYSMAAAALSEMAAAIGEDEDAKDFAERAKQCREKTEEYYWNSEGYYIPYAWKDTLKPAVSPFANINLRPLWIGYEDADNRQESNVIYTAKKLMNKHGTMKSSTKNSYYTGMTPGLLLYNFKAIGFMKRADMAYKGMTERMMSPTGETAEAYDGKDRWLDYAHEPNVYRPWETSINVEAILYYITGYKWDHHRQEVTLQPYLPPGVDSFSMKNLHAGNGQIDISLERLDKIQMSVSVINSGKEAIRVKLICEPFMGVKAPLTGERFVSEAYQRLLFFWEKQLDIDEMLQVECGFPYKSD